MRRSTDLREFASQPDRYIVGEGYICFHPDDTLYGFALWGDHDERTIQRMAPILDAQLAHARGPHTALADLRRLGTFDVSAYVSLAEQLSSRVDVLRRLVERHVLVRPTGAAGIMVSGFYGVARPPYPFTVVADASEAAEALGAPAIRELLARVDAIIDEHARPTETMRLRELFRNSDQLPEIDDAARLLATSARTLQRRLQEEGTSFRDERVASQLERAKHLLTTTDDKITSIASALGFTSLASFSTAFQKATGEAPSEWRERHRR